MSMHTAYVLRQKSPIIGELDSIKLFGAITAALAEIDPGKMAIFLKAFEDNNLRLSSIFPAMPDGDEHTYYLPMPKIRFGKVPNLDDPDEDKQKETYERLKRIKKIKYASKHVFEALTNKRHTYSDLLAKTGKTGEWNIKGKYLRLCDETSPDIKHIESPRNSLNRYNGRSEIFYSDATIYANCDMFFLAKGSKELISIVEGAIRFLEDRGFGQDYTTGFGSFKYIKKEDIELKEPEDPSCSCITLSLFYPKNCEISTANKLYSIREIKGITKNGKHIPAVIFIEEGSYFEKEKFGGATYKVPETNNILSGYAYTVKVVKCD